MSRFYGDFDPASTATTTITTEVVDTSSVVLYMPFDEDIQDDSGVGTSMAGVGGAFVQSSLTQFGAKALYLDGSGDYLQSVQKSSANSIFTLSSAAFTIDGWLYPQTFNEVISNFNASNPFAGFTASLNFTPHAAGKLAFFTSNGSSYDTSMASSTAFALNQWSHFAIVRGAISANSLEFFINGVKHGSHTVTKEPGTSNNVVRIGASNNSQPNRQFQGAMDDLRIIKGVALYSTNFSVPTTAVGNSITIGSSTEDTRSHSHVWNYSDVYDARFADTWPSTTIDSRISLYLPFEDDTLDKSSYNHTLTTSGPITLDTSQAKFGSKSARFAGSSYLTISDNSVFDLNGTDFTIEMFVYFPDSAGQQAVISKWTGSGTNKSFIVMLQTGAGSYFYWSNDGINNQQVQANDLISVGQWTHIAITQTGSGAGSGRMFINGNVQSDTDDFSGIKNNSTNVIIGGRDGGGVSRFDGFIEDLRVIKGLSLYTTAFTVPTAPVGTSLIVNP